MKNRDIKLHNMLIEKKTLNPYITFIIPYRFVTAEYDFMNIIGPNKYSTFNKYQ